MNITEAEVLALRIAEDAEVRVTVLGVHPLFMSGGSYYILCCTDEGQVFAILGGPMWDALRSRIVRQREPQPALAPTLPAPVPAVPARVPGVWR